MKPPATSVFRNRPSKAWACLAALSALWAAGCATDDWPDRDPLVVERAPVDTLEFLPRGSRFILQDSLAEVRFGGIRLGYACTKVLAFDLEKKSSLPSPGWSALLSLELPAVPDCALDDSSRSDTLSRRFPASEGAVVRLLDSAGKVLDTAFLARGVLAFDSLDLKSPALSVSQGRFTFRDTIGGVGGAARRLSADSLTSCEFLNHADFRRHGDTTTVRYSWITLDAAESPDGCQGMRQDALEPLQRRP